MKTLHFENLDQAVKKIRELAALDVCCNDPRVYCLLQKPPIPKTGQHPQWTIQIKKMKK